MKLNRILFIASVAAVAVSCDNFLDVKPIGKTIPITTSDFRALITDAYISKPEDRSYSAFLSDEAKFVPNDDSYIGYFKDIYIWNVTSPDANTYQTPWQKLYKNIFYANHIILNRDKMTGGTDQEVSQLVGEAFIMRANMYFSLVNLYSDNYSATEADKQRGVPIAVLEADLEKRIPPASLAAVYKQITDDLTEGIALLNVDNQPKGYNYRFSKISAYGLAARIYLYMGSYDKAKEYADKAMAISSQLEDLNTMPTTPLYSYKSVENILAFEVTFSLDNSSTLAASNSLVAMYDKVNDLRFNAFFRASGSSYKPRMNGSLEQRLSMRTAEFYLIKAEALARGNGDLTAAKDAIKALLSKRLKPDYYTQKSGEIDAMSREQLVTFIFDERARELAFQGSRWFDLKRNGKPAITKTYDGETFTLNQNDPRYVLKFPKDAIANNPLLGEN